MSLIKSISGIRGTIGGPAGEGLTPLDVVKFTSAFATFLKGKRAKVKGERLKLAVGRDARLSGAMVDRLVVGTLQGMGVHVLETGLSTTPTTEMTVIDGHCDGGIIITASHNPKHWNALKLLNAKGEFISDAEGKEVLRLAESGEVNYAEVDDLGQVTVEEDWIDRHIERVLGLELVDVEAIKKANFKVAVDAVNSTGGLAIPRLLRRLGVQDVVPEVHEPRAPGAGGAERGGGGVHRQVRHVGAVAQAVEERRVGAAQHRGQRGRHAAAVGRHDEAAAVEGDLHGAGARRAVRDGDRADEEGADGDRARADLVRDEARQVEAAAPGVGGRREDVAEDAAHAAHRRAAGVHGDGGALQRVEAAEVVEAQHVVGVAVREHDGVDAGDAARQRLLAEVGRDVDLQAEPFAAHVDAAAQARVPRVGRRADRARAADDRHAGGRAGAENRDDGRARAHAVHTFQRSVDSPTAEGGGLRTASAPGRSPTASRRPTAAAEATRLEPP